MNIPDIQSLYKKFSICLDMNSKVFESSACMKRLPKTTSEGLNFAYEMMVAAVKMRDIKLLRDVYNMANKLIPDEDSIDSVLFYKVKQAKTSFDKRLYKLLMEHKTFLAKYVMSDLLNQKRAQFDTEKAKQLEERISQVFALGIAKGRIK